MESENKTEKETYAVGNGTSAPSAPNQGGILAQLLAKRSAAKAPAENASATPTKTGNAFTALFGKSENETDQAATGKNTLASMLGKRPAFSPRALQDLEAKRSKRAKNFLYAATAVFALVYGFFYLQLEPNFTLLNDYLGQNVTQQFESSNAEIERIATDINLVRFRQARLLLDDINTMIDEHQILNAQIKEKLVEVQKILAKPLGVATFSRKPITGEERETKFEALLTARLAADRQKAAAQEKPNQDELRGFDNLIRLIADKNFRQEIAAHDFAKISDGDFDEVLQKIRGKATDELSAIANIRAARVDFAEVISEIHEVTKSQDVDPVYGQGLFKTVGGFLFSSYRFEASTGRISISGLVKRSDSSVFSRIAHFIDAIEKSPRFKDIDFRSFSKTRDDEGDYSSSLNLDFELEKL